MQFVYFTIYLLFFALLICLTNLSNEAKVHHLQCIAGGISNILEFPKIFSSKFRKSHSSNYDENTKQACIWHIKGNDCRKGVVLAVNHWIGAEAGICSVDSARDNESTNVKRNNT